MTTFGVNWDPGVCGSIREYRGLISDWCPWLRVVLKPDDWQQRAEYINDAQVMGHSVLGVLARESLTENGVLLPESRWAEWIDGYLHDGALDKGLDALQVGNEPDIESPSSWTMTPAHCTMLVDYAVGVAGGVPIIGPGLASGQPSYLKRLVQLDPGRQVAAYAYHPYGKLPWLWPGATYMPQQSGERFSDLHAAYRDVWDGPLWITEYGARSDEIGLKYQAQYVHDMVGDMGFYEGVDVAIVFCLEHDMVRGYGLYDKGRPTKAFYKFYAACIGD